MNNSTTTNPGTETGVQYWRSLDQLADAPEFRQWLEREFPEGASEFNDPVNRRHFVKIMGASFLMMGVGLTGCRRPEEKILPFAKQPENYIHGVPQYYASAMPNRGSALPLVVKSHDGRPTKIEGNALHPDSNGATNLHAQASILGLYDPDRAQRFARGGNRATRAAALDALDGIARQFNGNQGQGLAVLLEASSSPSRHRLQSEIQAKLPNARFYTYEPVDLNVGGKVLSQLAGKPVRPSIQLDKARAILSLDCDFVGAEEDNTRLIRGFSAGRNLVDHPESMNRLYVVESNMTLTGTNADHRLRLPASSVTAVAAAVATAVAPNDATLQSLSQNLPLPPSVDPKWIAECAKDLAAHRGASVVLAGHRQPPAVHALAALINEALGNVGQTVLYLDDPAPVTGSLSALAAALNGGQVDTLVILGANPVYNAPADLDWAATQRKAKTVVRLGYYEDETFPVCDWHLPAAHYLESWGDARTSDGTLVPIQPLIEPLFGGLTELEVLARIGGLAPQRPHDIVRATFQTVAGSGGFEDQWQRFLHDGFWGNTASRAAAVTLNAAELATLLNGVAAPPAPGKDNLEVVFARDAKLDDGRYNNNGWLLELPDPITKVTWDNVIAISRKTASEFGVKNGDLVDVELNGITIRGPVWIQPGHADYSLGLTLGYGRQNSDQGGTGRVGHGAGLYNAYRLRHSGALNQTLGAKLTPVGETYLVASTQNHGSMEGRPIVREANLEDYKAHPDFAKNFDLEAHAHSYIPHDPKTGYPVKIYEGPYQAYEDRKSQVGVDLSNTIIKSDVHQWGMSIDLTKCVGCTACVIACQSENNIPIVGKDQVNRDREMHWIRIDRYYSGAADKAPEDQIDDPQVVMQPMLCQHCEDAPCESVCPVNATVHDDEGLNVMAYNRCVGTRYCSNNCPYKVRRFNFFDYNKHTLNNLYKTPLATSHDGRWNMVNWFKNPSKFHTVPEDEWDLLKLMRNPDVSVRMRGIMEKCTFCVQRIEQAKISQKVKAGQSGDVRVPEGTFKVACQQACPADAIAFGNLLDPESRVSKLKKNNRDYTVLGFLDTRPRTTYLARIRNPNPAMPDYYENPLNLQEYMNTNHANPFEAHGGGDAGHHGAPAGAAADNHGGGH